MSRVTITVNAKTAEPAEKKPWEISACSTRVPESPVPESPVPESDGVPVRVYPMMSWMTVPETSVRRKSRPLYR
jgi:hypothetical protein